MTLKAYKKAKDRIAKAIKAGNANSVFWAEVAHMTDAQASAMMRMIAMDTAA